MLNLISKNEYVTKLRVPEKSDPSEGTVPTFQKR
jgi:hypothetical protein